MKKIIIFTTIILLISFLPACKSKRATAKFTDNGKITVSCYYFPDYHTRDKNDPRISNQHLENWSEWELVKAAKPRFEGHAQPKIPAWGYIDEKDPKVMAKKIDVATAFGIDVFIFDWYHYAGKPFLNRCLDEGFLKASNTNSIKFSLMWANHNWQDIFPYTHGEKPSWMYSGAVNSKEFDQIGDELVHNYFTKPNYWLIDGKAYFSIYDIQRFVEGFGSIEATKKAMDNLNKKVIKAGLKGIHWNLVAWGNPILPGGVATGNIPAIIAKLGFSSATSYVWVHHVELPEVQNDYNKVRDSYFSHWEKAKTEYQVPYFPNVTMGWDPSPRTNQNQEWNGTWGYPYSNTISNNTPENFKIALQMTKEKLLADLNNPRILNINCWNEWTEGSYLEPDTKYGMSYLEAVKAVFKTNTPF
jgi:hypothetical protein